MKSRASKQEDLEVLKTEFAGARSAFILQFAGLKVVDDTELRKKVRQAKGSYRVVRNTLARKASQGTGFEKVASQFVGPTAVVLADAEPSGIAKLLAEFTKTNQAVTVKAGLVEGAALDAAQCKALADVPSREVLQGKLVGLLNSPLQRIVTVLSAPSRNLAVVLAEGAKKKGG